MGSGIVYGVIVALWAVVLVPMWIRRHDSASETRSADRFSHAMRTLSPRPAGQRAAGQREMVMPARPATATAPMVTTTVDPRVAARRTRTKRRVRVLLGLVATAVLLAVLAAFAVVPGATVAVPVMLLVAYLIVLRRSARRSATRRPARRPTTPRPRPAPRVLADDPSVVVETKGRHRMWRSVHADDAAPEHAEPAARHVTESAPAAQAAAASAPELSARAAEVAFESDPDPLGVEEQTWQPVEHPLPTYVSAPKAVRPVRVIDLTAPGAWTSGRFLDEPVPEAAEAVAQAQHDADELDALLERRPAVND